MSSKQSRFCDRHNRYLPRDQFRPVRSLLCVHCEKEDTDNIAAGTHKRCSYGKHVVAIDQFNNLTETNCKPCISRSYERKQELKAKKNEEINKENEEIAGSNGKPKKQCKVCFVGKPLEDFVKVDADTKVVSTVDMCKECCARDKKRRLGSRMKKVNKKLHKLLQVPALCTGPGLPWLDQCPFILGLKEVNGLMNEDGLSEEERSRRMRAFSATIDNDHNGTRHLKTLDKKGRTVSISKIQDSEEEDRQLEITVCTCSNCHRMTTSWFGENTRVARADGSKEGSNDGIEENSDDDDDDFLAESSGNKPQSPSAGQNAFGELDYSDFADSEDEVAVAPKPKWKAPARKKMASFSRKMRASSSEEEDEDAVVELLSSVDLGVSDDEPVAPKPKRKAPATKKMAEFGRKKSASSSEDEEAVVDLLSSDDEPLHPGAAHARISRRGASAKPTNYKFGGSDDDDESDFDETCGTLQSPFHSSGFFPTAFL